MNFSKTMAAALALMGVQAVDLDYCVEYQKREVNFLWWHEISSSYCCKDCCFITITSDKACTKNYCMSTCPVTEGKEEGECYIKEFENHSGSIVSYNSMGCDQETQFCKYIGDPEAFNDWDCVPRLANTEPCDNSMQCQSHKCSQFIQKTNKCYDCYANNTMTVDRGREITNNHCNETTQYCGLEDDTCHIKVDNGEKCNNNNYMCKSNKCHDDTDLCAQCLITSDCENSNQFCTTDYVCKEIDGEIGDPCSKDEECSDVNTCVENNCRGNLDNGKDCLNPFECASGICNFQLCGDIPKQIGSENPDKTDEDKEASKSSNFIFIGITIVALMILGIIVCIVLKKKKVENQDPDQTPAGSESISLD